MAEIRDAPVGSFQYWIGIQVNGNRVQDYSVEELKL